MGFLPGIFSRRRPVDFSHLVGRSAQGTFLIVGTKKHGFIPGKLTAKLFLPTFARICAGQGFRVKAFPDPQDFLATREIPQPAIIILVYSEVRMLRSGPDPALKEVLARARQLRVGVVHPLELGVALADKLKTRELLVPAGIRMPELISQERTAGIRVFSNEVAGSNRPVRIHAAEMLDPSRYNTRYIDAVHQHQGRSYHVSLRAMAVGSHSIALYVRARPVTEGSPSVHNKNTPVDRNLLNQLHEQIVAPKQAEIHDICRRIGDRLGLGFYAHDIVPERETGLLYVCETGFKFDDHTWRDRMNPLRGALSCDDGDPEVEVARSAQAFLSQWAVAREMGK